MHLTALIALMSATLAGPPPAPSMDTIRLKGICKISDQLGRLDILSHGRDEVSLRIVTPHKVRAEKQLQKMFSNGLPPGIKSIRVETPRPMISFVLDDVGLKPGQLPPFWRMGQAFTYAVLPGQAWTDIISKWLLVRFASTLVHMPMEPEKGNQISFKGYLTVHQDPADRLALFKKHFKQIKGAIGFNNHQGSRLTTHAHIMRGLLKAVPAGYLVLDSRTSRSSQLGPEARKYGLPTAYRTVFVDHVPTYSAVMEQLESGLATALVSGEAVVIGHPHKATHTALADFIAAHGHRVHFVAIERLTKPRTKPMWMKRCEWRKWAPTAPKLAP